jgi:DNA adenine methylase
LAFGWQVEGVFGVSTERPARSNLSSLAPLRDTEYSRLEGVVFENLDWQDVLTRHDGPKSLFYLDPPYFAGENDCGKGMFDRSQFATMAEMLRDMGGAFILSINDTPEIREIFEGFHLDEVRLKYTVSAGAATDAAELIISNREIKTTLL